MDAFWSASGAAALSGANTFCTATAPPCAVDEILLAVATNRASTDVVGPGAPWNVEIISNGGNGRAYLFWRRAIAGDSGASWTWTRASNSGTLQLSVHISSWGGVIRSGSPFAGPPIPHYNTSSNANINYDTYTPTVPCLVVALGYYSVTGAGPAAFAIAGTNPTFANHYLVKNVSNWFGYSGLSTGVATGARSHDGTDGASNISTGILLGLVGDPGGPWRRSNLNGGPLEMVGGPWGLSPRRQPLCERREGRLVIPAPRVIRRERELCARVRRETGAPLSGG